MTISVAERAELRTAVGELLADKCTEADVRRVMESDEGFDRQLWRQLAEQGVLGMLVDDEHGGLGFDAQELQAVAEETGAALLPAPFISSDQRRGHGRGQAAAASFAGRRHRDRHGGADRQVRHLDGRRCRRAGR